MSTMVHCCHSTSGSNYCWFFCIIAVVLIVRRCRQRPGNNNNRNGNGHELKRYKKRLTKTVHASLYYYILLQFN